MVKGSWGPDRRSFSRPKKHFNRSNFTDIRGGQLALQNGPQDVVSLATDGIAYALANPQTVINFANRLAPYGRAARQVYDRMQGVQIGSVVGEGGRSGSTRGMGRTPPHETIEDRG